MVPVRVMQPSGLEAEEEVYDLIYGFIRATRPQVCIETGTAAGVGTHKIASALDANGDGHVWTVDINDCSIDSHSRITSVRSDSLAFVEGFNRQVDFAFVDCCFSNGRSKVVKALLADGAATVLLHDTKIFGYPDEPRPDIVLPTERGLAIWQGAA
jgi:cephalosporin hydroxylase